MIATEVVVRRSEPQGEINAEFKQLMADILSARCAGDRLAARHDLNSLAHGIDGGDLSILVASLESIVQLVETITAIQSPAKIRGFQVS